MAFIWACSLNLSYIHACQHCSSLGLPAWLTSCLYRHQPQLYCIFALPEQDKERYNKAMAEWKASGGGKEADE